MLAQGQLHGREGVHHHRLLPPLLHVHAGHDHGLHGHVHHEPVVGLPPPPGSVHRGSQQLGSGFGTLQLQSSPSMDTSSCRWVRCSIFNNELSLPPHWLSKGGASCDLQGPDPCKGRTHNVEPS